MHQPEIGVAIQAFTASLAIDQIRQAEEAGIPTAWATIGGAGGGDILTTYAAAMMATRSIRVATAIVPTWPRHPLVMAQQALAIHHLAPGRLRLGIGPSHEPAMTRAYGAHWRTPLTHLREYLQVLRILFTTGTVDFQGEHFTARAQWREPVEMEILASALRPRSFDTCGELSDGAISWMCPRSYLVQEALPALRQGAERADRPAPPLIAHVPVHVGDDREAIHELARQQLGYYARLPFYAAMFERAGFPGAADGYPAELLDDLVVCGSEDDVVAGLRRYIDEGCGEVLAAPLIDREDREGSIERAFRAVARANAGL